MNIKYLLIFALTVSLHANKLECRQIAHLDYDSSTQKSLSEKEQQIYPVVTIDVHIDKVNVLTPSGKWFEHKLTKEFDDEKQFFSTVANTSIRKLTKKDIWVIDMRTNGKLVGTVLNCK